MAWASGATTLAIMGLVTFEVIARKFFKFSLVGTVEIVAALLVVVAYFALSYTESQKGHVHVEFLVSRFGHRTQLVLETVNTFLVLGIFSLIVWQSWGFALDAWRVKLAYQTAPVPVFPFRAIVSVGTFFFCVLVLSRLVSNVARLLHIGDTTGKR